MELAQALDFRLELRYAFLRAIELSELRSNPESLKTPWIQMKAILDPIYKSQSLGIPVPESFSAKLQRRLASTMPPRPIVHLSFEDAISNFKRLSADGTEVTDVLKYSDSQSLLVRMITSFSYLSESSYVRLTLFPELHPLVPSQEATATGIHTHTLAKLCFQRHGTTRFFKYPPSLRR